MAIMSTGQITIVDLTDERLSSFYLQANKSKIQVFDVNTKTYSPNFESSALEVSPYFFFGNDDYSSKLNSTNLTYTINGAPITNVAGVSQSGSKLTIARNINPEGATAPFNQDTLKIIATIKEQGIEDEKTGLKNNTIITAEIEFAKVSTGLQGINGVGVSDVNQLYKLSDSATSVIAPTESNLNGWSEANPSWGNGTQYLWICTETIYTDNSKSYSTPYTDNNWKTAVDAVKEMEDSFSTLEQQVGILQNEVDSAIETWYLEGNPNDRANYPWYDSTAGATQEDPDSHVGDLYYDTKTGYSYRFFEKSEGVYEWTRISDSDVTKALEDVANLQTVVDGKVTIYYDATEPKPSETVKLNVDDLWMPQNGNFYKWNGIEWVIANEVIDRIEVQYNKNQSNTEPPVENDSNWSTTTPDWEEGWYIWQRTVTYYREDTEGTKSTPTCISVAGAKGENAIFAIVESNSKILFTDKDEADIVLNAILYVGGKKQETDVNYKWSAIPATTPQALTNTTEKTITVKRDHVLNLRTYICEITYNGETYTDRITITDRTDPVYCVIESKNGDKFTNGTVDTELTCKVFDSSGEVDSDGTKYVYKWYKTDATNDEVAFKTGKTISVKPTDVNAKAIFSCIVEKA